MTRFVLCWKLETMMTILWLKVRPQTLCSRSCCVLVMLTSTCSPGSVGADRIHLGRHHGTEEIWRAPTRGSVPGSTAWDWNWGKDVPFITLWQSLWLIRDAFVRLWPQEWQQTFIAALQQTSPAEVSWADLITLWNPHWSRLCFLPSGVCGKDPQRSVWRRAGAIVWEGGNNLGPEANDGPSVGSEPGIRLHHLLRQGCSSWGGETCKSLQSVKSYFTF